MFQTGHNYAYEIMQFFLVLSWYFTNQTINRFLKTEGGGEGGGQLWRKEAQLLQNTLTYG